MTEAIFPLLGPVLVFAVILPLSALLVRLLLSALDRVMPQRTLHALQELRYFLLVMTSGAPLVWFVSASLHQAETGRSARVCTVGHASTDAFCPEAAFFGLAVLAACAALAFPRFRRMQLQLRPTASARAAAALARVEALLRAQTGLTALAGRIHVIDELAMPIATTGMFRPRVAIRSAFIERLDDAALSGALHHELAHVRGRDPLRYCIAWWALAVNPLGRLFLQRDMAQWFLARELHCDREAVLHGASGPAVAHAIVTAARPERQGPVAALGITNAATLKLRVDLLLAYAEQRPARTGRQPSMHAALCALLWLALLPHSSGTGALDAVHVATESAVLYVSE